MILFLKRLLFVIGFFPGMALLFVRWLLTGKNALDTMGNFERWAGIRYDR